MMADMQRNGGGARLLYYAAWLKARIHETGASASKAKLYASDMVNRVVYQGGARPGRRVIRGRLMWRRMYRDCRVITFTSDHEVRGMIIARELLGAPYKQKVPASYADL